MVNEFKGFSGIEMIDEGAAGAVPVTRPAGASPTIAPVSEPLLEPTDPAHTEPSEGSGATNKVVIVGSGPAGLTAAIYAARANLEPLVIAGYVPGGQLMITSDVENYPGFPDGIQGPELMDLFRKQAARFGSRFVDKDIERVDFSERPFRLWAGGVEHRAEAVIIATGASAIWLGLESETRLRGRGVSACATCDGFFFRNKHVAVVGGGDSALEEATFLTKFADRVTMIHRRDDFRGSKIMRDRALRDPKIDVRWNSEVAEVLGVDVVSGLRLRDTVSGEESEEPMDGLFVAIGHKPNTEVFRDWLEVDPKGYLVVHDQTATKVEGVFVAGDVHDHRYRQAVTAAGDGCRAAIDAERWLESVGLTVAATSTAW